MRKQIFAIAVLSALTVPAFAEDFPVADAFQVTQRIELKDGTFLNVYKDGKAGMENKFGRSVYMKPGQTMQTKDGRTVTMIGNETYRVERANPLSQPGSH